MGAKPLESPLAWAVSPIAGIMGMQQKAGDKAEKAMKEANDKAIADAAKLKKEMLEQPKKIQSDNFLAYKNKQLNKLRLGMASTITGAGSPFSGSGLKTKLGQ